MEFGNTVHIVDDDECLRRTISRIAQSAGYRSFGYASGDIFLADIDTAEPGCVVLDVRMPGSDGLRVQEVLRERYSDWPVLMLTGHADIGAAVQSLKGGAIDFLQKPFRKVQLLAAIAVAHQRFVENARASRRKAEARARIAGLSPRETQTLAELRKGLPHKLAAYNLGISIRTIEVHRAQALRKLEVRTLPEALQIVFDAA